MTRLSDNMFQAYVDDPYGYDDAVRRACAVPDNRYYTVSTWPPERAGWVAVIPGRVRTVRLPKVSKSNQPPLVA